MPHWTPKDWINALSISSLVLFHIFMVVAIYRSLAAIFYYKHKGD